ncbi:MAG: Ldh family oxidoreductase [candidate division Zixibacteria bacterium]|nr:Ldh family oxidoreductase [candidate division Zixibacteria bacterium]
MNRPPEEYVLVREDRLLEFSTVCFEKAGLDRPHAHLISRLLVNSDLRGVRSHGTRAVNGYCTAFEQRKINPHPNVCVIQETAGTAVIDGDGTLGYWPMVEATHRAIEKAKTVGVGMGVTRHIGHYGSAGHYTRICQEAGCIGFSVQGTRNHGNARGAEKKPQLGYLGNPPLSFAIPQGDEPPVVLDLATRILADYQKSPEFDDLLTRIPAAFFKSIGYGAVANLLGGALAGITLPSAEESLTRWPDAPSGGMVLAIDVEAVVSRAVFQAEVDRYVKDIRETYEPMPGCDAALLPGAVEAQYTRRHREQGIRYGAPEQASARQVAERLGVALPWDESER